MYWDPQVMTGKYTKKCDIFSLGLVIFLVFMGEDLFGQCKSRPQLRRCQEAFFLNPDKMLDKMTEFNPDCPV